jgi:SPP1 family predicted phage head-tail adaptor
MPEHPGIEAGTLDKRVTLLAPQYNAALDEIVSYAAVTTVWASIMPETAMELNQAGRTVATTRIAVVIRYRADIDARWRVQDRDRVYQIKGIDDVMRRHVQLQLTCMEVE